MTTTTFTTPEGMKIVVEEHSDTEEGWCTHHFEMTISMPELSDCLVLGTHGGLAGIEIEGEFSEKAPWP